VGAFVWKQCGFRLVDVKLDSVMRKRGSRLDGRVLSGFTGVMLTRFKGRRGVLGALAGVYGQRRRVATFGAAGLAVALGYHVVFGHNGLTVYELKRQETQGLTQQLEDLTKENERLQGHVERLKTDPNAIEHQAREELHYTRPGEVIVTLPPDQLSELTQKRKTSQR
jgi:cell division protein FtsB